MKKPLRSILQSMTALLFIAVNTPSLGRSLLQPQQSPQTGSVIFIHPDGAALSHWNALRMWQVGPDGWIHWDHLPQSGIYRGHMLDGLAATSHSGGTVHAFGVKVPRDSYGMNHQTPLTALSGFDGSLMKEAQAAGLPCGIVNSGSIIEPGTGCFLASSTSRENKEEIALQIVESGADVILSGGERWLLPDGMKGVHGTGSRIDGRNLIREAESNGYHVVYTRKELKAVPPEVSRLLGVFAHKHSFHDESEEVLQQKQRPLYVPSAPTLAEMTEAALKILNRSPSPFFLVVEEEGTDNFSNHNNARGMLEAMRRADEAIGVAHRFLEEEPDTLIVTGADSDASGAQVLSPFRADLPLPAHTKEGAPLDGRDGPNTLPFLSAPDDQGRRHGFGIAWIGSADTAGGILSRAEGLNSEALRGHLDNTDIYRLMYATLFGQWLD